MEVTSCKPYQPGQYSAHVPKQQQKLPLGNMSIFGSKRSRVRIPVSAALFAAFLQFLCTSGSYGQSLLRLELAKLFGMIIRLWVCNWNE
jgi:hypothetical protein